MKQVARKSTAAVKVLWIELIWLVAPCHFPQQVCHLTFDYTYRVARNLQWRGKHPERLQLLQIKLRFSFDSSWPWINFLVSCKDCKKIPAWSPSFEGDPEVPKVNWPPHTQIAFFEVKTRICAICTCNAATVSIQARERSGHQCGQPCSRSQVLFFQVLHRLLTTYTRFQSVAIMALQEAAEAYLTTLFEVSILNPWLYEASPFLMFFNLNLFLGHSSLCYSCQTCHHYAKVGSQDDLDFAKCFTYSYSETCNWQWGSGEALLVCSNWSFVASVFTRLLLQLL